MNLNLIATLKKHYLFALYLIVTLGVLIGLIEGFNLKYTVWVVGLYILPLILFYLFFQYVFEKWSLNEKVADKLQRINLSNKFTSNQIIWGFIAIITVVFLLHIIYLKGFPGIEAIMEFHQRKLVYIRRAVTTKIPDWFKYVHSFIIKGLIPMGLLFAYYKNQRKAFYILTILAFLYGLFAMQKGHFITFYGPTILMMLLKKEFKKASILGAYIFSCLLMLVFITNPGLKHTILKHFIDVKLPKDVSKEVLLDDSGEGGEGIVKANKKAVNTLYLRTFFLPGATVGRWFEAVPKKRPYLYGKGYRFYAKITGQKYHDYGEELYGVIYPKYVKRGFVGRVNVASFMYDYVNFKQYGLVFSAFCMALLLSIISMLFFGDSKMLLVMNTTSILYLSSTNYTTLLLSGGWALIILLYLLFFKQSKLKA